MDLNARIEALERKNAVLWRITSLLAVCVVGMVLLAAAPRASKFGAVECQSLKVTSPTAQETIQVKELNGHLGLFVEDGAKPLGMLVGAKEGVMLVLGNGDNLASVQVINGVPGLSARSGDTTMGISPGIASIQKAGKVRAAMSAQGPAAVLVADDTGAPAAMMMAGGADQNRVGVVSALGPGASITDLANNFKMANLSALTHQGLVISDSKGTVRSSHALDPETGEPRVLFNDAAGKEKKRIE